MFTFVVCLKAEVVLEWSVSVVLLFDGVVLVVDVCLVRCICRI